MSTLDPVAFRVSSGPSPVLDQGELLCTVRALAGMQKEALVASESGTWRLASDEGHYLNGTDLAPPPLDFFSVGMQLSVLSAVVESARRVGVDLARLRLEQDTVYHIAGSFLGGNARGDADPPVLHLFVEAEGNEHALRRTLRSALTDSSALALARTPLENRFGLTVGGARVPVDGLRPTETSPAPSEWFEPGVTRALAGEPIISKLTEAERIENDPHGAGVGLRAEQKRTIHLRGRSEWTGDGRFRSDVELVHPIGSSFRFHGDGEGVSAPSPETYLVAGVAFCYMTQLGRFAAIRKKPLEDYRIVQRNRFGTDGGRATCEAFDTEVVLEAGWSEEDAADLVRVGERTCYLHATMRQELEPRVRCTWNGKSFEP